MIIINTRKQMEIVLRAREDGKSRGECAKIAGIPLHRINHWYTEGKNGYDKDNVYFYKKLKRIEDNLANKEKYEKDIEIYNIPTNSTKRKRFLDNIKAGQTRRDASRNAFIDLKLITKWDSLGKKGISPFDNFHNDYVDARNKANKALAQKKQKIKNETIKLIKTGKTLKQAAKLVYGGKYEKTILNWYTMGKSGNKNHEEFYIECLNAQKPTVSTDIYAPLPKEWQDYFKKLPMNKTGIAWVNKGGNNWHYQRQINKKPIKISDSDIKNLHRKVISKNYLWGIRNLELARKVIDGENTKPPVKPPKEKITVTLKRPSKNKFKATVQGIVKHEDVRKILNDLEFFEFEIDNLQTTNVNGKTNIKIEYDLGILLINSFENTINDLGWEIIRIK